MSKVPWDRGSIQGEGHSIKLAGAGSGQGRT